MRARLGLAGTVLLAAALALPVTGATAAPAPVDPGGSSTAGREGVAGNGVERSRVAATAPSAGQDAGPAGPAARTAPARPSGRNLEVGEQVGYPRQTRLRVYPDDPTDRSLKPGLVPYDDIAPILNRLQRRSDRVSVDVIGQSVLGRDLYLVTLTAPETAAQARQQERWRRLVEDDPTAAARNAALQRGYKTPIFVNANIHGNEWEGTDGVLRVLQQYATSRDPAVARLLTRHRVYFNVTLNPDGRVAGTRRNANGFDMNRDWVTASQPEVRALRSELIDMQPVAMLDEHGYVNPTLIEPTTPPHGQNYEYDLFIKYALANGEAMRAAVEALGFPETEEAEIPFLDYDEGWDDWPPIFTPQYAAFHGAIAHTIEIPLRINNQEYDANTAQELRRRATINTAVVVATIEATVGYVDANRDELLAMQTEIFRRGWAGAPRIDPPVGFVEGWGPEDRGYVTTFPRAYVIPVGGRQRSAVAAARLVDFLVANDVRVTRAQRAFSLAGRRYPAGSYLVDMRQPKRGLANVMLEAGRDISDRVDLMYDISGWSHRLLWGASVDIVRAAPRLPSGRRPVVIADPTGSVAFAPSGELLLRLVDGNDVEAVNALAARGYGLRFTATGDVLVPAEARGAARELADRLGVQFRAAPAGTTGRPLGAVTVAAAAAADELFVLRGMGFRVVPISTASLAAGFDWSDVDVAYVSSGVSWSGLGAPAQAAFRAFAARGGGVVTRGATGAAFNAAAGLLDVDAVQGNPDANGVVRVANARGPVTAAALPHSFVYSPLWFTGLGAGVRAEQTYVGVDPLVAGHWTANLVDDPTTPDEDDVRPDPSGAGGPGEAAGQAAVVRGVSSTGAPAVLFGTEPLFRAHPKGLFAQVGRALFWASTAGVAPAAAAAPADAGASTAP